MWRRLWLDAHRGRRPARKTLSCSDATNNPSLFRSLLGALEGKSRGMTSLHPARLAKQESRPKTLFDEDDDDIFADNIFAPLPEGKRPQIARGTLFGNGPLQAWDEDEELFAAPAHATQLPPDDEVPSRADRVGHDQEDLFGGEDIFQPDADENPLPSQPRTTDLLGDILLTPKAPTGVMNLAPDQWPWDDSCERGDSDEDLTRPAPANVTPRRSKIRIDDDLFVRKDRLPPLVKRPVNSLFEDDWED